MKRHLQALVRYRYSAVAGGDRGDTIVEVLIAISIISLILTGSFTTAQESRISLRDSEEHAQALQILQGQIERLRPLATSPNASVYNGGVFCLDNSGAVQTGFPWSSLPPIARDNFRQYPSSCSVPIDQHNPGIAYNLSIAYAAASQTFTFTARWDRLSHGRDQVALFYRLPPPPTPAPSSSALPSVFNCSQLVGNPSVDYYFTFDAFPAGNLGDWHVHYLEGPIPPHPIGLSYYAIANGAASVLPAGTYYYWEFGEDSHRGPGTYNRSLHYRLYDSTKKPLVTLADTPEMSQYPNPTNPPTGTQNSSAGTGTFTISAAAAYIDVEHSAKQVKDPGGATITYDRIDASCLALHKIN